MVPRSSIRRLPPCVRDELDRWLNDPAVTMLDATARVNSLLADSYPDHAPVSRSAVNRYSISMRGMERWRKDAREIAAQARGSSVEAAREAGRAMGRLAANRLPARVHMHLAAGFVEELASTTRSRRQRKEPK